jgi:hypothetical protein
VIETLLVTPATTVYDVVPVDSTLPAALVCEYKFTVNASVPTGASTVAEHAVAGGGQFAVDVTGELPDAVALIDIDCVDGETYCGSRAAADAARGMTTVTCTGDRCCVAAATCETGGAELPLPPPPQPANSAAAKSAAGMPVAQRR